MIIKVSTLETVPVGIRDIHLQWYFEVQSNYIL